MKHSTWFSILLLFFRNGKLIEESEKYILKGSHTELTIKDIKNIDAGPYVCEAKNKAGNDKKQTFLQVFGKYFIVYDKFKNIYHSSMWLLLVVLCNTKSYIGTHPMVSMIAVAGTV